MNKRDLTSIEQNILERLLSKDFPGKDQLKNQINGCLASDTGDDDNYGSIYLFPDRKSVAHVERRVPVDGLVKDSDGIPINILLHVEDGFLHELEITKLNGAPLKASINIPEIEVILNQD